MPAPYTRTDAEEFLVRAEERHRTGEELSLAIVATDESAFRAPIAAQNALAPADGGALLGSISVRVLLARLSFERIGLQRVEIVAGRDQSGTA